MARIQLGRRLMTPLICLLALLLAGCACAPRSLGTYIPLRAGEPKPGTDLVVLWFVCDTGATVPVTRELPQSNARTWTAVNALCAGPMAGSGLRPSLPSGAGLRKVVYWPAKPPLPASVDLDFSSGLANPQQSQLEAIARTVGPLADIGAMRVLIQGVPVAAPGDAAELARINVQPRLNYVRFLPVKAGDRVYLSPQRASALGDSPSIGDLLGPDFAKSALPRGTKLEWATTPGADGTKIGVTLTLRRTKLADRDWQAIQLAADAIALTVRSVPGTEAVEVTVAGQERSFIYNGSLWPNPEQSSDGAPGR